MINQCTHSVSLACTGLLEECDDRIALRLRSGLDDDVFGQLGELDEHGNKVIDERLSRRSSSSDLLEEAVPRFREPLFKFDALQPARIGARRQARK